MIRAQYAVTRTVPTLPTAPRGVLSPVTSTSASLCGQGATYVVYKNINLMHQMVRVCVLKLAFSYSTMERLRNSLHILSASASPASMRAK